MSLFFGWFYSKKAVPEEERDEQSRVQKELFAEMKRYHFDNDQAKFAERKYDYDEIYDILYQGAEQMDSHYGTLDYDLVLKKWVFPSPAQKLACFKACESYLDNCVVHKQFLEDYTILKMAVCRRIMTLADNEGFFFDWHYFQLYRRSLSQDLLQKELALLEIEHGPEDSSDWSDDE